MTEPQAPARASQQSGVTLIEVVVALAVIALTLTLAATGLHLLGHSGARGARLIARHDILSRGIDVLRRDIARLERAVWKRGEDAQFVFHGGASRLTFVAIEPAFPSEPGPYVIDYTIEQHPDGDTLTRARAPFEAAGGDILRLPTQDAVAVIEGHYRLRFLYFDRRAERDRWLPRWSDTHRLPALIALKISGPDGTAMPPVVLRPRIDAEAGCVRAGSGPCTAGSGGALASSEGNN